MSRRRAIESALVLLAVAPLIVPVPATIVERWFSTGIYPRIQQVLTALTNLVPFAWFDVILITAVAVTATTLVRMGRQVRRERHWRPLRDRAWQFVVAASVLYVLFLACWGLNYRRVPMSDRLEMLARSPGREEVLQLGMTAVKQLNALHDSAHRRGWAENEWRDPGLVAAFAQAQQLLEDTPALVPGRLKQPCSVRISAGAAWTAWSNPYALEVLVNPDLLPWERPFVAAHEWSHLAGFADESEASFVGWLACLRGHEAAQYSAWLYLYSEVVGDVGTEGRQRMTSALAGRAAPRPRSDRRTAAARAVSVASKCELGRLRPVPARQPRRRRHPQLRRGRHAHSARPLRRGLSTGPPPACVEFGMRRRAASGQVARQRRAARRNRS